MERETCDKARILDLISASLGWPDHGGTAAAAQRENIRPCAADDTAAQTFGLVFLADKLLLLAMKVTESRVGL